MSATDSEVNVFLLKHVKVYRTRTVGQVLSRFYCEIFTKHRTSLRCMSVVTVTIVMYGLLMNYKMVKIV